MLQVIHPIGSGKTISILGATTAIIYVVPDGRTFKGIAVGLSTVPSSLVVNGTGSIPLETDGIMQVSLDLRGGDTLYSSTASLTLLGVEL